jgi:hypothetical protein
MGPKWGQRIRRADPTRLIAGFASGLTSANNSNAGASPPEKRKVGGSIPPLATSISAVQTDSTPRSSTLGRFAGIRSHPRMAVNYKGVIRRSWARGALVDMRNGPWTH